MKHIAVVQCSTCKTIVGDTILQEKEEGTTKKISIEAPVNVHVIFPDTAQRGHSRGIILCNSCLVHLGHCPLSDISLKDKLSMCTFRTDRIQIYNVGLPDTLVNPLQSHEEPSMCAAEMKSAGCLHSMDFQVAKMQNILLLFHERLEFLEKSSSSHEKKNHERMRKRRLI